MNYEIHTLVFIGLLFLSLGLFESARAEELPENAYINKHGGWSCNEGYVRMGDICEEWAKYIPDPEKAFRGWRCHEAAEFDMYGHDCECEPYHESVGGECVPFTVPENGSLSFNGNSWDCNAGYKKSDNSCLEMTEEEKQQKLMTDTIKNAEERAVHYGDSYFSLDDIQIKCKVHRNGENSGEVKCETPEMQSIESFCQIEFSKDFQISGMFNCGGKEEFEKIEGNCIATMTSDGYAEVEC